MCCCCFPLDIVSVLSFFTCKKHEKEGNRKTTTDDSVEIKRSSQELLSDLKRNPDDKPKTQDDCTDLNTTQFLCAITSNAKLGLHAG